MKVWFVLKSPNLQRSVFGGKFKFQVQDSFLEYFFWRFEKHIALSEKKPPLPSLLPLLGMPATDRCYQLNEDGFMLFAQMRKKRFSASSVVYNNTIWITGVKEFLVLALFGHCAFRHLFSFYIHMFFYILISFKKVYPIKKVNA